MRSRSTRWSLALLAACVGALTPACTASDELGDTATLQLTPDGGLLGSNDGVVQLDFPTGAVAQPIGVSVGPTGRGRVAQVATLSPSAPVYRLGPEGARFDRPVSVRFELPPAQLAEVDDPSALTLIRVPGNGTFEVLANQTTNVVRDPTSDEITAIVLRGELDHFSDLAVTAELFGACCDGATCGLTRAADCTGSFLGGLCSGDPCGATGACCNLRGECSDATVVTCDGGFEGPTTSCAETRCPVRGVCCGEDASCSDLVTGSEECDGTLVEADGCDPNPCAGPPPQACCNGNACTAQTAGACVATGGVVLGSATCAPNPCAVQGSCCRGDGTCAQTTAATCDGAFVAFDTGNVRPCPSGLCEGACCDEQSQCAVTSRGECAGLFVGPVTGCEPNPCPNPIGACCGLNTCEETFLQDCDGQFVTSTGCTPNPCPNPMVSANVALLCVGVEHGAGESFLSWNYSVTATDATAAAAGMTFETNQTLPSLEGQTLVIAVDGPTGAPSVSGVVDENGEVLILGHRITLFGRYPFRVVSVGDLPLLGDLEGAIDVGPQELDCP